MVKIALVTLSSRLKIAAVGGGLAQLKRGEDKRARHEGAVMAELWSKGW